MKNDIHHLGQEQQKKKKFAVYVDNQKINKDYSDYTLKKVTKKVAKDLLGSKEKIIFHLEEKGKLGKTYGPYMGSREGQKVEVKTYKMSGGVIGKIQSFGPVLKGTAKKTFNLAPANQERKNMLQKQLKENQKRIEEAVRRQNEGALTSRNERFAKEIAADAERAAELATRQATQASELAKNVLKNNSRLTANQDSSQLQNAATLAVRAANTAANAVKNAQRTNSLATQEAASNALKITANAVINTAKAVVQTTSNTPNIGANLRRINNKLAQETSSELINSASLLMNSAEQAKLLVEAANTSSNQGAQIQAAEAVKDVASATANLANTSIVVSQSNAINMEKNAENKNLLNEIKSTIATFLNSENSNKASLKEIHNKIGKFLNTKQYVIV